MEVRTIGILQNAPTGGFPFYLRNMRAIPGSLLAMPASGVCPDGYANSTDVTLNHAEGTSTAGCGCKVSYFLVSLIQGPSPFAFDSWTTVF